uniref:DNA-directed RNA polymerase n=1 Tax=viral metagenome TaxID=1070528 RepID=A0A6C0DRM1_9ZZZZ
MDNSIIFKILDSYFQDNPQRLVTHHIESYNDFFKNGIFQILKEKNPIQINTQYDKTIDDYRTKCVMYIGGKNGDRVYFGKPVIYDDDRSHYMFPNEGRLRNMTYGMTIHYDVEVEFIDILRPGELPAMVSTGGAIIYEDDDDLSEDEGDTKTNWKKGDDQEIINPEDSRTIEKQEEQLRSDRLTAETTNSQLGGALAIGKAIGKGDKPKRGRRKKASELAPSDIAILREATEKSMISPNTQRRTLVLEKIFLGKFPIMVQSDFCVLSGLPKEIRHTMGECLNDIGGYFIIDGKEKTVVAQEKFADNMVYIREVNDEHFLYSAEIRSVSENVAKPIRTLSVKIVAPSKSYTNKNIVVNIPNVRKPVPLFILFRALGVLTDKQIISMCLLDMDKYESMVDLFIPSVHDAGGIMTQRDALNYIAILTKGKTIINVLEILSDYFLPHVGEVNFYKKAYYLGYLTFRLLSVYTGLETPTDRDNFKYKRIELVGSLMSDLFREYYKIQQREIYLTFEEQINYNAGLYEADLYSLVQDFYKRAFSERSVESGFRKAFKGNWGAQTHTKRVGIVQDLNRLSFNSALSHLRKTNLPLDSSVKLVGPRLLNCSQWGYFDPIDTPDGASIGIHKHLSISTYVSQGFSREPMIKWLREKVDMKYVEECSPLILSRMTKVIVNGLWAGSVTKPLEAVEKIKLFRRNALLPIYTSVTFEIKQNTIYIYTDAGRLCRPIFYWDTHTEQFSFFNGDVMEKIEADKFTWRDLTTGFNKKMIENFDPNAYKIYELSELYNADSAEPSKLKRFLEEKAVIDFMDCSESENAMIALNKEILERNKTKKYTHLELHDSVILGMMGNLIIYPENNPVVRNSFSCGQSKQAVSMYHTNHRVRMDKTAVVLNYGQTPLVKSRYLEYINHEGNPYGENAIVAIMCYTGYNVEDAILINEGSLKRGLFRTTYYSTYETHEEKSMNNDSTVEKLFTNIENESNVVGTKPGYDYSKLDKYGLIKEGTDIDDKTILIGITATASGSNGTKDARIDMSKTPKKGQLGTVDKTFITDSEEGKRIAKVRIREQRIPNLGDKMASRSGQKGTIGLVIPEEDMPFTKDGIRPDLIINPHALPTRMTIGQLVETLIGKACVNYGGFGDCTAFINKGSKIKVFGELLPKIGFHSSGNEILYNGMTGEQLETEIFMGPTYYMRLKHMVKDKINYRARGPNTALTKQPVQGRANDGGLRIGEMERDSVISHGTSEFLRESMMERSDNYFMAICNTTGMMAIYNPAKNIFMSPMADGPLRFVGSLDGKDMHIENVTRFGRDFSIVKVPYTLKLLMQELQTINIQMRFITEDNIEQLENMTYSKNIDKLMFTDKFSAKSVINNVRRELDETAKKMNIANLSGPTDNITLVTTGSPEYAEGSPAFFPNEGDITSPYTGEFNPNTPSPSPLIYYPNSPDMPPPDSPDMSLSQGAETPILNYSPHSPDEPAPPLHEQPKKSDEKSIVDWIFKGGKAHLRGDTIPVRTWTIKNVGDRFVTIGADNMDGLDLNDNIKVVMPHDLYEVGNYSFMQQPMLNMGQDQPMMNMNNNGFGIGLQNTMMPDYYHPAINIAPVIKVLNNSSDNSTDPTPSTPNHTPSSEIINNGFETSSSQNQNKNQSESNDKIDLSKIGGSESKGLIVKKLG